jgi:hypothetical protein
MNLKNGYNCFNTVTIDSPPLLVVQQNISSKFDMKDLDAANFILGIDIKRDRATRNIWLNQMKYIEIVMK